MGVWMITMDPKGHWEHYLSYNPYNLYIFCCIWFGKPLQNERNHVLAFARRQYVFLADLVSISQSPQVHRVNFPSVMGEDCIPTAPRMVIRMARNGAPPR